MRSCAFGNFHPAVILTYFLCVIVLCVLIQNLAFQLVGFMASAALYLSVARSFSVRGALGLLLVFALIVVINPLFSTEGSQVLFTYFGRPYTFEAVLFGLSTALMFVTMLLWLMSLSKLVGIEEVQALFANSMAKTTLVLTMIMRLVPAFGRRARLIAAARSGIGKDVRQGTVAERVKEGTSILRSLTAWSLESSIVTADSMRSRGYGTCKRSSSSRSRFRARDGVLLGVMLALFVCVGAAMVLNDDGIGAMSALGSTPHGFFALFAFAAFTIFVLLPVVMNLAEGIAWRAYASKI